MLYDDEEFSKLEKFYVIVCAILFIIVVYVTRGC